MLIIYKCRNCRRNTIDKAGSGEVVITRTTSERKYGRKKPKTAKQKGHTQKQLHIQSCMGLGKETLRLGGRGGEGGRKCGGGH